MKIRRGVDQSIRTNFSIRGDGALRIGIKFYVLALDELKREILDEAYSFICYVFWERYHILHFVRILSMGKTEVRDYRICG